MFDNALGIQVECHYYGSELRRSELHFKLNVITTVQNYDVLGNILLRLHNLRSLQLPGRISSIERSRQLVQYCLERQTPQKIPENLSYIKF